MERPFDVTGPLGGKKVEVLRNEPTAISSDSENVGDGDAVPPAPGSAGFLQEVSPHSVRRRCNLDKQTISNPARQRPGDSRPWNWLNQVGLVPQAGNDAFHIPGERDVQESRPASTEAGT